jgi:hypothetical protein
VLAASPFLAKLTELVDQGRRSGNADLEALHAFNPDLMSFRSWLGGSGRQALTEAMGTAGAWRYGDA